MNIGRILKYLLTGVIVGAILFFAGFGVMNMLKDDSAELVAVQPPTVIPDPVNNTINLADGTSTIAPPSINVAEGTSSSPIKIKPIGSDGDEAEGASSDGEATDEATAEPAFGTLTLKAINSTSKQAVNADFLIQNDAGAAIAQVKSTPSTTLSFPSGSYKITVNQGASKIVRYLGVKSGQVGSETFELDVPVGAGGPVTATAATTSETNTDSTSTATSTTDVATTSTATESSTTSADATIIDEEVVVTESADSVEEATVSETTNASTDQAENAATEDDSTELAAGVAGLRVSAQTKEGKRPLNASFYIQRLNGENIDNVKNVATHQFSLPAGSYRITARRGTVRMVKQIKVVAGQGMHEIFSMPSANTSSTAATTTAPKAVTPPKPAATPTPAPATPTATAEAKPTGRLELFARDAASNKPVRSNFYIQTPQGKLVTSKTYVESIGYKLPAAQYKVTVRATGYQNKVVTLNVRDDQTRRETFKMELVQPATPSPAPVAAPVVAPVAPAPAVKPAAPAPRPVVQQQTNNVSPRGGLRVNVVSPQGQPLQADIMVLRRNGTPVKRAINASTANFDLAPRNFVVRVRYGGFVTNQQINVIAGKMAIKTITFDLNKGFRN